MELNDLVKMLVKAENPRQQAIEQAQAPKVAPTGTFIVNGTVIDGTQLEFKWGTPVAATDITTATPTNAVVSSSVTSPRFSSEA